MERFIMKKLYSFGLLIITILTVSMFIACDSGSSGSDTTAPTITGIGVTATETEATITWKTSENADSKVEYGATTAYGAEISNATREKTHSIQLTGLTAGTEYHFRVISADKSGNETVSGDNTFTTDTDTGVTVNVSEMISAAAGGTVTDGTTGSTLNIPAGALSIDTTIQIGSATGFPQDSEGFGVTIFLGPPGTVFQTPITLTVSYDENDIPMDLFENELFLLLSEDDGQTWTELETTIDDIANTLTAELSGFSLVVHAARRDTVGPTISSITSEDIVETLPGRSISFITDELATGVVRYGTTPAYGQQAGDETFRTSHNIQIKGLSSNTQYFYQIDATDVRGNTTSSEGLTFTTVNTGDTTPPIISGIHVQDVGDGSADVYVSYETNEPASGIIQFGETTTYSKSITLSDFTTSKTFRLPLAYSTGYHAKITAADEAGNFAMSDDFTFTSPSDTTPPVISDINEDIDKFSLSLTYKTDKLSLSYVNYGLTEAYGLSASASLTPALDHSVTIPGLMSGTLYNYEIVAIDENNNLGSSGNRTFTTVEEDTDPPTVSDFSIVPDYNKFTVSFSTNELARSKIDFGLSASYTSSVTDNTYKTDHSIEVTGLMPETMYHLMLSLWDESGNMYSGDDETTTTLQEPLDIQFTGVWVETINIGSVPPEISGLNLPIENELTEGLKLRVYADINPAGISLSDGQNIQLFMTYPNNTTTAMMYYTENLDDPCTTGVDESLEYSGYYTRVFDIDSAPELGTYTFSATGPKISGSLQTTMTYSGSPIEPAVLVSPAADAEVPPPAAFNWSAVSGASTYLVTAVPINSNFDICGLPPGVFSSSPLPGETTVSADSQLVAGERYLWTVWSADSLGQNSSISFRMFDSIEPDTSMELILQEGLNGYAGTKDNTIYEGSIGEFNFEEHSNGGGDTFIAGNTNDGFRRRALLQFDLSAIPSGSTIESAELELTVAKTRAGSSQQTLYRMFSEWGEGTADAGIYQGEGTLAGQDDATWLYRLYSFAPWADPGAEGNYFPTASATAGAGGAGTAVVFSDAGLVQDIQNFVSGTYPNRGWLIKGDESADQTTKAYHSSESSSASKPKLTITYTPPID